MLITALTNVNSWLIYFNLCRCYPFNDGVGQMDSGLAEVFDSQPKGCEFELVSAVLSLPHPYLLIDELYLNSLYMVLGQMIFWITNSNSRFYYVICNEKLEHGFFLWPSYIVDLDSPFEPWLAYCTWDFGVLSRFYASYLHPRIFPMALQVIISFLSPQAWAGGSQFPLYSLTAILHHLEKRINTYYLIDASFPSLLWYQECIHYILIMVDLSRNWTS